MESLRIRLTKLNNQLDICLFRSFFPTSPIQPSIHAYSCISLLTHLPSTTYFCSFLSVIHLWQPTPLSHILSLSTLALSHKPDINHHSPILYVCLFVSVHPTHNHTFQAHSWHLSTVVLLHSTYFVFPHCGWYQMFVLELWMHNFLIFSYTDKASHIVICTCRTPYQNMLSFVCYNILATACCCHLVMLFVFYEVIVKPVWNVGFFFCFQKF